MTAATIYERLFLLVKKMTDFQLKWSSSMHPDDRVRLKSRISVVTAWMEESDKYPRIYRWKEVFIECNNFYKLYR